MKLKKVPQLWKTSCIVPVPKIARPSSLKAQHLRPQLVCDSMDPLQFVYEAQLAMDDAIICLLYRAYSRLKRLGNTLRAMFFVFCIVSKKNKEIQLGLAEALKAIRLNMQVRKASPVMGLELDSLGVVVERRMRDKFKSILRNPSHPLYAELWQMGSTFCHRFISPRCKTERFKCSFVPAVIRMYNSV